MTNPALDADNGSELEFVRLQVVEPAKKTFFYQKKNGDGDVDPDSAVFACTEQEAGLFGRHHKLIGSSDGTAYQKSIRGAKVTVPCSTCKGRKTIEKLTDTDQGVKARNIVCTACEGEGTEQQQVRPGMLIPINEARRILQEAFDAELAAARGNLERPRYQNVHFDASFPVEQRSGFIPPR